MTLAVKYNPNQPRDPGGEGGGQWTSGGAGGSGGMDLASIKTGMRLQFSGGTVHDSGKQITDFRGTVSRKSSDGRLMVNAGTTAKPKWVITDAGKASPVIKKKPAASGRAGWKDKLTPDEAKSVVSYKENGYRQINRHLREGVELKASTKARVAAIDRALTKGTLTSDTRLYRGFNTSEDPQKLVGSTFHDKSFVSTSEGTAEPLKILAGKNGNKVLARLNMKAGQPAGFPDTLKVLDEREVLLPRDSKFRVTAAKKDKFGIWTLDMEAVT